MLMKVDERSGSADDRTQNQLGIIRGFLLLASYAFGKWGQPVVSRKC